MLSIIHKNRFLTEVFPFLCRLTVTKPSRRLNVKPSPIIPRRPPVEHGIKVGGLPKPQTIYIGISWGMGSTKNMQYTVSYHIWLQLTYLYFFSHINESEKFILWTQSRPAGIKSQCWFTRKLVALHFNELRVKNCLKLVFSWECKWLSQPPLFARPLSSIKL